MNGRITIKIEGQDVPLLFAYPAIKWFAEASAGSDIFFTAGEEGTFTAEGLAKLMQCAHRNACMIKEIEPSYSLEAFYDWVMEKQSGETTELLDVMKCYADSSVMQKAIKAVEGQKKSDLPPLTAPLSRLTSTPSNGSSMENLDGHPLSSEELASVTLS